jgi:hypothetical protein
MNTKKIPHPFLDEGSLGWLIFRLLASGNDILAYIDSSVGERNIPASTTKSETGFVA